MKWIPVEWEEEGNFNDLHNASKMKIVKMNSPFYEGIRYAVRHGGMVLNISGEMEFEPSPSNRDDAFYERCRFKSFEEAQTAADKYLTSQR